MLFYTESDITPGLDGDVNYSHALVVGVNKSDHGFAWRSPHLKMSQGAE